ncbi:hypothetical protein TU94_18420 [Streptomyces cyaneogriseus subsp. noncyanogenus]|uniref:Secreted protein n=1 Tax=Streptomyces cyaneogriseus subsp. noncyanogenus TaxID=477245 RepID=A0A0C5G3J3_9ACTN|nr:hypothetical protein [Streptomyces cyaneogriseus]AJP03155.1 hypothetical protein TU94_18420 [Streptomyces cyaneogriseus subsp. noncyanogenus]
MSHKLPARTRAALVATGAVLLSSVLVAAFSPVAAAAASVLPLPLPLPAAADPLVSEGITIEGPLINTISLPTLK